MAHKTNAARILDQHKIAYDLKECPVDEKDLSADHMADLVGIPEEQVYKTLVLVASDEPHIVAMLPSNRHLSLKKLAQLSGNKKCEMLHMKELQKVTGYIRGGCSPIGMKKKFPTYIDESILQYDRVYFSAGKRGLLLHAAPQDLIRVVEGITGDLLAEEEE